MSASGVVEWREERVGLPVGTLQVFRAGAGPTLVSLHSSGGESITPALDALAPDFAVVAPLLPGFGESEGIEDVDTVEDVVFVLLELWDALELERPVVMGCSLGGWVALELATRHPERVGAMVLVNPVGIRVPEAPMAELFGRSPAELAPMLFADLSHPIAQAMLEIGEFSGDVGKLVDVPAEVVLPYWKALGATAKLAWDPYFHNPKLAGRLHRATVPTLVVVGAHDTLVPPAVGARLAELLPDARLEVIEDAAHWLPLEKGEVLADRVRTFARERAGA